ncbi:MAG TPA: ABC transporter permease, partial [Pseudobdellovibrionaceae bacterium]|nr:ABC transporter permease [Pseudobdellovibrionaceae bacterium]
MIKLFYLFSIRNIFKKPVRWILSFLSIILGVSLFVSISLINEAVLKVFQENMNAVTGKAQISISSGERGLNEDILQVIEETPGVYSAAPLLEMTVTFKNKNSLDTTLRIMAVDLLRDTNFREYDPENPEIIEDPLEFFNQEDSIVITHEFAKKNNLKMDESFELITVEGPKKFTVRGLLKPTGAAKAYGGAFALMDITGAQFAFGKQGLVDRIDVICEEDQDIDQVLSRIKERIDKGFDVERSQARNQQTENMIRSFQSFISLVGSMAWFIGLFFIFNSIYISVAQRRTEIGILRGIGADRRTILWLFIFEALTMGLFGSLLGLYFGEYMGQFLVNDVTSTLSTQFQTTIQAPYIEMTQMTFFKTLAISTFATFLSSLWPSLQATLVHPIEAIKAKSIELYTPEDQKKSISWAYITIPLLVIFGIIQWTQPKEEFLFAVLIVLLGLWIFIFMTLKLTPVILNFLEDTFKKQGWVPGQLALQNIKSSKGILYANMGALFLSLFFYSFFSTTSYSVQSTVDHYMETFSNTDFTISAPGD